MKRLLLVVWLTAIAIVSCSKKEISYTDFMRPRIDSLVQQYPSLVKEVIILPTSGCTGCVQAAEQYLLDNLNNDSILFILTEISSLKVVKIRFGSDIIAHKNVFIDTLNYFYPLHFQEVIYPFVGEVSNGKLNRFSPF